MDALPPEISTQIYQECTAVTQLILAQTCRYFLLITDKEKWRLTDLMREYWKSHIVSGPMSMDTLVGSLVISYGSVGLLRHLVNGGWKYDTSRYFVIAVRSGSLEVLDYLYKRGMRSEPVQTAIEWNKTTQLEDVISSPDILKYCIERRGMELDSDSALHVLEHDYLGTYKYLTDTGLVVPEDGHIDCAASFGSTRILHHLISEGYDFVDRDSVLKTAVGNLDAMVLVYLVKRCGFKVDEDDYLDTIDYCNYLTEEEAYDDIKKFIE